MVDIKQLRFNFTGKIIRKDPDGSGVVELDRELEKLPEFAFFSNEVLQNPAIDVQCRVGGFVAGRVELGGQFGGGAKILRMEPVTSE